MNHPLIAFHSLILSSVLAIISFGQPYPMVALHGKANNPAEINKLNHGSIAGLVRDGKTNETIIGANLILENTGIGSSTNLDGKFELVSLEPGKYNLLVSFISYKTQKIEGVVVARGRTTLIDIKLEENSVLLETVQVSARKASNTDVSVIAAIRKSGHVISGISAQQIARSQDNDAARVIRRIPGVTVVDDRFVIIRGLGERYNPVMLNSVTAPSMEADIRSFSFDIVPSPMVDQILIFKSPSPDLPGDLGGGVVKILTKSIPDENSLQVSYSAGMDPSTSFRAFMQQAQMADGLMGINLMKPSKLPKDFPANLRQVVNAGDIEKAGRSLKNNWLPETINSGLNHSLLLNGSLRFDKGTIRIGNITSVSYNTSKSIDAIQRRDYNLYDEVRKLNSMIFDFNDEQFNQHIRAGVLHNWALSFGKHHTVEFRNLYNQLNKSQYVHRTGRHLEFNYFADNHSFYQIFRGIYSGQLGGKHTLFNDRVSLDWVAGYGYSCRDEPDYRRYRSDKDTLDKSVSLYVPVGAAASYFLGRFFSEMIELTYTAGININHKLFSSEAKSFNPGLSYGLFYEQKGRQFNARNLGYIRSSNFLFDQSLLQVGIDSLFHPSNINNTTGIRIDEQTNPSDSYTAGNNLVAGYMRISLPVIFRLTFAGGVRLEQNHLTFNSFTLTNSPVVADDKVFAILPSASLTYNLSDKSVLRLAYGKTVNRPEFRELAPFGFYDFNYNFVRKGNVLLRSARLSHIELRAEHYPSVGQVIMAGIFYKKFRDPIESTYIPGGGTAGIKTFTYYNAKAATSLGVEAETRISLGTIAKHDKLKNVFLIFNAALIRSEVELGYSGEGQKTNSRQMQGQSPYIVNAGAFYQNPSNSFNISVLYNVVGKRIFMIGYDEYSDIYEMPRHGLDVSLSKSLSKGLDLKAGVRDLLNNEFILMQDSNADGIFNAVTDQVIEKFYPGRTFSLGISWKI